MYNELQKISVFIYFFKKVAQRHHINKATATCTASPLNCRFRKLLATVVLKKYLYYSEKLKYSDFTVQPDS